VPRSPALLGVAASAFAALVAGCGGDAQSARPAAGPPPVVVELATVERARVEERLAVTGQLEADESVMIRSETAGIVASVEFREGQEVARDALLFRLRDDEQRARLREAEAQVVLTEHEWRRAEALLGEHVLSAAELDRARAARDAAQARVDLARVEVQRTEIRAPFDGVLGQRLVSPGDRVTDATDLVALDAVARLKVAFSVPELAVEAVRVSQPVSVTVAAFGGQTFTGTVFFVAPSLDPRNRRLTVKAAIENTSRALRPGMFAAVQVETAARAEALMVPESAVVYDTDGPFVWRTGEKGVAERVAVGLGVRHDGRVEVTTGLAEGERVVSAGTNKVVPGRAVAEAGATTP